MSRVDLNLLVVLDIVLAEGSVARAAQRLQLSPSAMSRALARLRKATGDPLLVRAGHGLAPTPRAIELHSKVTPLLEEAEALLRPQQALDLLQVKRTFILRSGDGFVENFGLPLITRIAAQAPGIQIHFTQKAGRDNAPLRDGLVDLETGVVAKDTRAEFRTQSLFYDRFIGVVRKDHPLSKGTVTPARYASGQHIELSCHFGKGLVDRALETLGLHREITLAVGGFAAALALAQHCDLIATVPERHTGSLRSEMLSFRLPFQVPEIPVSMLWHPRQDADPTHRWLRKHVRDLCSL